MKKISRKEAGTALAMMMEFHCKKYVADNLEKVFASDLVEWDYLYSKEDYKKMVDLAKEAVAGDYCLLALTTREEFIDNRSKGLFALLGSKEDNKAILRFMKDNDLLLKTKDDKYRELISKGNTKDYRLSEYMNLKTGEFKED